MMEEEENPNPDELLKAIQKQEAQKGLGSLKIFFGMSAGVGKTYAMLEEAQQKLKEGVNVVVGTINTHGRKETEDLLQGFYIIPEKWVKYKDTVFEEMDLETILDMKPAVVIVDELAHTNVPGSKHLKRWQDVIEILNAGIDVYTTLNVQHIESRKDIVEGLTGIQVRETVPDLVLERAGSIELIDIPPPELLKRLMEGKVYLGDQSKIAAENFFQEENLMALREIALRFTAEKVDHDLHGILHRKGWKTRERLMVAISSSPSSEQLIRAARRLAFELDAPWITVYVDTGVKLSDQDQSRLNQHFNLARDLGAEVITTHDLNIAAALQRIVKQKDITRIVIGRSPSPKFPFFNYFKSSFIDSLEKENKNIDIVILRQEKTSISSQKMASVFQFTSPLGSYGLALVFGFAITVLGYILQPILGYKSIGFIFLLGILALSFFVGRGPILFAAILSALCWDYLFISPIFTGSAYNPEDIILVIIYFIVATALGVLTSRTREQDRFLHQREETTERLYEIERDIAVATNLQSLRLSIASRLENLFGGKFDILTRGSDNRLILDSQLSLLKSEKEQAAVNWVFQHGKVGGWSTDTLPSAEGLYFPVKFAQSVVGVLAYHPNRDRSLSMDEMNFIQTVAQQLGICVERFAFEERIRRRDYISQIERMHQSIFHSLNRSFYIPLEGVSQIALQMRKEKVDPAVLAGRLEQFISNIKLIVDNIIAISELESGFVHFDRKKLSIKELVEQSLSDVKPFVNDHAIEQDLPSQYIFLPFDFTLLKLSLNNLLLNAFEYSAPGTTVLIRVQVYEKEFQLSVLDEGPGIPEDVIPFIFDKFYHSSGKSEGLGLGLAIVRAVVDIHQGKITVKNRDIKGTEFSLFLPI